MDEKLGTPKSNDWRRQVEALIIANIALKDCQAELKEQLQMLNPCGHTGFESNVCEICGYPDSRKVIAALSQRVKDLESRCEQRTEAAANTLAINRQLRDKIGELEASRLEECRSCPDLKHWREGWKELKDDQRKLNHKVDWQQVATTRQEIIESLEADIYSQGRDHTSPCNLGMLCPWCRIKELKAELSHIKANHLDMVNRNAFLRQRPDLKADRIPAYLDFVKAQERVKELEAENAKLIEGNRILMMEDGKYRAFWEDSRLADKMTWEQYEWPKHRESLALPTDELKDGAVIDDRKEE